MAAPAKKRQPKPSKKGQKKQKQTSETGIVSAETGIAKTEAETGPTKPEVVNSSIVAIAETVDSKLVERATKDIKKILDDTVVRAQSEVGEYILQNFYNNNIEEYRRNSPKKHASLSALVEKCETMDLPVKRTFLHTSINVAIIERKIRTLGESNYAFPELPPSHQAALLSLRKPDVIESAAAVVQDQGLTVKDVRALVKKKKEEMRSSDEVQRGRPPKHDYVKMINSVLKALTDKKTGRIFFPAEDIRTLKNEEAKYVEGKIEELQDGIDMLKKRLKKYRKDGVVEDDKTGEKAEGAENEG